MNERASRAIPYETIRRPRSQDIALKYNREAIARGVLTLVDQKKKLNPIAERSWKRAKLLFKRYVTSAETTYEDLRKFAHGSSRQNLSRIIRGAAEDVWEASPEEMKLRYPKYEVLNGLRIEKLRSAARKRHRLKTEQKEHVVFKST